MHVWVLKNSGYNLISSFFTKIGLHGLILLAPTVTLGSVTILCKLVR